MSTFDDCPNDFGHALQIIARLQADNARLREVVVRMLARNADPEQQDHDEYLEEMSLGGRPYKPR